MNKIFPLLILTVAAITLFSCKKKEQPIPQQITQDLFVCSNGFEIEIAATLNGQPAYPYADIKVCLIEDSTAVQYMPKIYCGASILGGSVPGDHYIAVYFAEETAAGAALSDNSPVYHIIVSDAVMNSGPSDTIYTGQFRREDISTSKKFYISRMRVSKNLDTYAFRNIPTPYWRNNN